MKIHALVTILFLGAVGTSCQQRPCYSDNVICETYVHRYGVEMQPSEWLDHGESGKVVSTLRDGVTVTKNFNNGVLDGEVKSTFPHRETVEKIQTYDKGRLVREQTFYLSGVPRAEVDYSDPPTVITKTFFDQGTPRSIETVEEGQLVEGKYYNLSGNVETGVQDGFGKRTNRDEFGQLVSVDSIKDGVMLLRTTYHSNGIPSSQTPYRQGIISGTVKTFMPAGDPKTIEQWTNGIQDGMTVEFEDGEKAAEVPYIGGVRSGVEKRFSDGGNKIVEEITWVRNQRHGPAYRYVNGQIVEEWYLRGQKVNKATFDRLTGPPMP